MREGQVVRRCESGARRASASSKADASGRASRSRHQARHCRLRRWRHPRAERAGVDPVAPEAVRERRHVRRDEAQGGGGAHVERDPLGSRAVRAQVRAATVAPAGKPGSPGQRGPARGPLAREPARGASPIAGSRSSPMADSASSGASHASASWSRARCPRPSENTHPERAGEPRERYSAKPHRGRARGKRRAGSRAARPAARDRTPRAAERRCAHGWRARRAGRAGRRRRPRSACRPR